MIDYAKVLAIIDASPDRPAALKTFVAQEREAAVAAAQPLLGAGGHVCHPGPAPAFNHTLICPTGEHIGGWQHMGGPHEGCAGCR